MIINSNGVNIDTNTQRSNAEINALIDAKLTNVPKKTLIKSISLNISANETVTIDSIQFTETQLFGYYALLFEFSGEMSVVPRSSQNVNDSVRIQANSVSIAEVSSSNGHTGTLSNFSNIYLGGDPSVSVDNDGLRTITRSYVKNGTGDYSVIKISSTAPLVLRFSGVNSPVGRSLTGTLRIYGIK